jgi:hypothetical protein
LIVGLMTRVIRFLNAVRAIPLCCSANGESSPKSIIGQGEPPPAVAPISIPTPGGWRSSRQVTGV